MSEREFEPLSTLPTQGTFKGFIKAILVWLNKPHVINRRLCGSKLIKQQEFCCHGDDPSSLGKNFQSLQEDIKSNDSNDKEACSQETDFELLENVEQFMIIRDLLPKSSERQSTVRETVIIDRCRHMATFYPVCLVSPMGKVCDADTCPLSYRLCYMHSKDSAHIELQVQKTHQTDGQKIGLSVKWIEHFLLPKIVRWSEEKDLKTSVTSLRLVPVDEYSALYQQLKQNYGQRLVESWTEKTDPQKFVFEDIAIATYLLLLWREDRKKKDETKRQTFVDLGCGNGLLVYILSSEGHQGLGIDVRRRQIWDMFSPVANLKECSITPSADSLFSEYDWIIGNHSDELTPWIPVIAARSSYTCSYFVLPCCHFDFDKKFSYKQSGSSQYRTYLDFIREVGHSCGFTVEEDTLRIPSTKRVCFVGRTRTYAEYEEQAQDKKRSDYINVRCESHLQQQARATARTCDLNVNGNDNTSDGTASHKKQKLDADSMQGTGEMWAKKFEPRCNTETTRNCQSVDRHIREHITKTVFDALIQMEGTGVELKLLPDGKRWRKGGSMPLSEVVGLFDRDVLYNLKAECGGLQTLLKNQSSVFKVIGGVVRIKDPHEETRPSRKSKQQRNDCSNYYKTAPCWFYRNHPDGCPKLNNECNFAHGDDELKQRPSNKGMKNSCL